MRFVCFLTLYFLSCAVTIMSVNAHEGASGIIKERMDSMKSLGDHAKIVGDMFKGKTGFDLTKVRLASDSFIRYGQTIPAQFPDTHESRRGPMTEALPAIWDDWQRFTELAEKFTQDSRQLDALLAELQTSDVLGNSSIRSVRSAFYKAVKSCSDCHKRFRLDNER